MKERRGLEMDLRQALNKGEFELHYQPLVNLQTNEITAFEALLRWNHPVKGLISPADFMPIAEETGLIVPIGEWVLRTACKETANWPEQVKVAVNLSPAQLKSKNLMAIVMSALEDGGMRPERLQLEITETMLMQNTFATLGMLHQLRKLGVQIAMDDFGTGYSSLSYLRSFPFDKIKIDRSFIAGSVQRRRAARHRPRGRGPGEMPQHDLDRRRRRDPAATGHAAGGGLHRNAGLSVQPRQAGPRDHGAVRVALRQGGERLKSRPHSTIQIRVRLPAARSRGARVRGLSANLSGRMGPSFHAPSYGPPIPIASRNSRRTSGG